MFSFSKPLAYIFSEKQTPSRVFFKCLVRNVNPLAGFCKKLRKRLQNVFKETQLTKLLTKTKSTIR